MDRRELQRQVVARPTDSARRGIYASGVAEEKLAVELSDDERALLRHGLGEWWGPAKPTDALAAAMGFGDQARLDREVGRLMAAIDARAALTLEDWRRVLVATEIAFASEVFGSGTDWSTTTGISDGHTIALLRAVQVKWLRSRVAYKSTPRGDGQVT